MQSHNEVDAFSLQEADSNACSLFFFVQFFYKVNCEFVPKQYVESYYFLIANDKNFNFWWLANFVSIQLLPGTTRAYSPGFIIEYSHDSFFFGVLAEARVQQF